MLFLPALELAAKLAPVVAQGVVDVINVLHEHAKGTPAPASQAGMPFREILNQRRQEQEALQNSRAAAQPSSGR